MRVADRKPETEIPQTTTWQCATFSRFLFAEILFRKRGVCNVYPIQVYHAVFLTRSRSVHFLCDLDLDPVCTNQCCGAGAARNRVISVEL
jgi:hypothetical protein